MDSVQKIQKAKGLTLLELIIALAIWSIMIAPFLYKFLSADLNSYRNAKDQTLASYIAQNHIAELQLEKKWPAVGKRQGELKFAKSDWLWKQEVVATSDENLRRVTVSIEYGKEGLFSMTGFVGKK